MTKEEAIEYLKRADITVGQTIKTRTAEALEMAIEALQMEFCEDAISRQAVVVSVNKALSEYMGESLLTYSSLILDYIKALPSVQPTVCIAKISFDDQQMKEMMDEAISNLDFSDLISRQAAIDLCERFDGCVPYSVLSNYDMLPSVTPR